MAVKRPILFAWRGLRLLCSLSVLTFGCASHGRAPASNQANSSQATATPGRPGQNQPPPEPLSADVAATVEHADEPRTAELHPAADVPAPATLDSDDSEAVHDDVPEEDPKLFPSNAEVSRPSPYAGISETQLAAWLQHTPEKLGSLSIGRPNGGALLNAVHLVSNPLYAVVAPGSAWATQETADYLSRSISQVQQLFPTFLPLYVGDISAKNGGRLAPHLSHQSGRDVDISYFYSDSSRWYTAANAKNLDVEKTWAFVRALATESDVEMLLIDSSIQLLLKDYAQQQGDDPAWVQDLFKGTPGVRPPLIRHVRGHRTHIHIRFYNPIAQESARELHSLLLKYGKVRPQAYSLTYTAKKGDSLNSLAKRFGTSVKVLRRVNGLKGWKLFAKKTYQIPRTGTFPTPEVRIPPRRLPATNLGISPTQTRRSRAVPRPANAANTELK